MISIAQNVLIFANTYNCFARRREREKQLARMSQRDRVEEPFLDIMYPVLCFTCGENIASRVNMFEELKATMSVRDALDEMQINLPCSRQYFITGGSNLRVTKPCSDCIKGKECQIHKIFTPVVRHQTINVVDVAENLTEGDSTLAASASGAGDASESSFQTEQPLSQSVEERQLAEMKALPLRDRVAILYDSSHLLKVDVIRNPPTEFGLPVHLSEYDDVYPSTVLLDSNHVVSVSMGQVYKVCL